MGLIGIPVAAQRAGMTPAGLRKALLSDEEMKTKLVQINAKAWAIDEEALADWIAKRGFAPGRGRPKGAKNKKGDVG